MIPPDAARILAGLPLPAAGAGRDPEAARAAILARLSAAASVGVSVPARVEADLGQGLVRLLVDGQPLVAASPRPLPAGTQVRLTLVGTGPGQVPLVAIDTAPDAVEVSAPAARLQALGLPPGPAAQAVLTAFAREGAPLDRPRLQRAVAAVLAAAAAEGRSDPPLDGGSSVIPQGGSVPRPGGSAPRGEPMAPVSGRAAAPADPDLEPFSAMSGRPPPTVPSPLPGSLPPGMSSIPRPSLPAAAFLEPEPSSTARPSMPSPPSLPPSRPPEPGLPSSAQPAASSVPDREPGLPSAARPSIPSPASPPPSRPPEPGPPSSARPAAPSAPATEPGLPFTARPSPSSLRSPEPEPPSSARPAGPSAPATEPGPPITARSSILPSFSAPPRDPEPEPPSTARSVPPLPALASPTPPTVRPALGLPTAPPASGTGIPSATLADRPTDGAGPARPGVSMGAHGAGRTPESGSPGRAMLGGPGPGGAGPVPATEVAGVPSPPSPVPVGSPVVGRAMLGGPGLGGAGPVPATEVAGVPSPPSPVPVGSPVVGRAMPGGPALAGSQPGPASVIPSGPPVTVLAGPSLAPVTASVPSPGQSVPAGSSAPGSPGGAASQPAPEPPPPGTLLPPVVPAASGSTVAAAHARLAALGLPATEPLLALAERAVAAPATGALVPEAPPAGSPLPPREAVELGQDPTLALRLAGVRVEGEAPTASLSATALAAAAADPAAIPAARDAVAEAVLPGQDLADYDRVIPIPLVVDGQPTPARLAVGGRDARPGQARAAWLRLDADLAALGPVSVRLSDSGGGPLAITLAARGDGARALADGLPDLIADLERLGLAAAVRVVEELPDG